MIRFTVRGEPWRCRCGGSVFTKEALKRYRCNSCGQLYAAEK